MANGSRVLVTGGAGFIGRRMGRRATGAPTPVEHVRVGNGEMPTNPNHPGARVAETRA
jgi:nucleoside-diphosphate-sugar epimerase